jgi:hypothetical protein
MAKCHRDKIPRNVERQLWGEAGGHCANPDCRTFLVISAPSGRAVSIGEMAHVIAWSPAGPRGEERGLDERVDRAENLLLLCPACHKMVDDVSEDFPANMLVGWRDSRRSAIRLVAGAPRLPSRAEVVAAIGPLLRANRAVHAQYGPESEAARDPLSDAATTWRREAIRVIIPNNRRILEIAATNDDCLDTDDRDVVARFKVHAEAFEYNQVGGSDPNAPTFPRAMTRFET